MKKILFTTTLLTTSLLLSGCLLSPEQIAQMRAQALKNQAQAQLSFNQAVEPKPEAIPDEPAISEAVLIEKINALTGTGEGALFKRQRDGLLIDEDVYLDPEGEIVDFAADAKSGKFTYIIKRYDGSFAVRYFVHGSSEAPVTIATAKEHANSLRVRTATGKKLTGHAVIPTTEGIIVTRASSAFQYKFGQAIKSLSVPRGYHVAAAQKGDVSGTGYILLEKNVSNKKKGFFDDIKSIGNTLGINQVDDYVLANIETKQLVPLDVNIDGKNVHSYSGCRQHKSGLYNKCSNMSISQSIYKTDGSINASHYFWSIDWYNTEKGPIALYKTTSKLKAVEIEKETVHTVFSRALGINNFFSSQDKAGKVSISAQLGFSSEKVEDLTTFIENTTPEQQEPMQTLGD